MHTLATEFGNKAHLESVCDMGFQPMLATFKVKESFQIGNPSSPLAVLGYSSIRGENKCALCFKRDSWNGATTPVSARSHGLEAHVTDAFNSLNFRPARI
jgi:hypothetical protein